MVLLMPAALAPDEEQAGATILAEDSSVAGSLMQARSRSSSAPKPILGSSTTYVIVAGLRDNQF